jgi:6-phosphogluconolactonase (cycloisomerase 2 family)
VYAPYGGDLFVYAYNRSKDRVDVFRTSWDTNTTTATTIQSAYGKNLALAIGNESIIAAAQDSVSSKLHAVDLVLPS